MFVKNNLTWYGISVADILYKILSNFHVNNNWISWKQFLLVQPQIQYQQIFSTNDRANNFFGR